eukprot:Nk52_evm7s1178 gene=Nk52_evmTU7s1178
MGVKEASNGSLNNNGNGCESVLQREDQAATTITTVPSICKYCQTQDSLFPQLPKEISPYREVSKKYDGVQVLDIEAQKILLGMKRRGFGVGKWQHVFGGKREKGETSTVAALRELQEETGLVAKVGDISPRAILFFEFTDENIASVLMEVRIYTYLLKSTHHTPDKGHPDCSPVQTPIETDEITPKWFNMSAVPYEEMWADNAYWIPEILQKTRKNTPASTATNTIPTNDVHYPEKHYHYCPEATRAACERGIGTGDSDDITSSSSVSEGACFSAPGPILCAYFLYDSLTSIKHHHIAYI